MSLFADQKMPACTEEMTHRSRGEEEGGKRGSWRVLLGFISYITYMLTPIFATFLQGQGDEKSENCMVPSSCFWSQSQNHNEPTVRQKKLNS